MLLLYYTTSTGWQRWNDDRNPRLTSLTLSVSLIHESSYIYSYRHRATAHFQPFHCCIKLFPTFFFFKISSYTVPDSHCWNLLCYAWHTFYFSNLNYDWWGPKLSLSGWIIVLLQIWDDEAGQRIKPGDFKSPVIYPWPAVPPLCRHRSYSSPLGTKGGIENSDSLHLSRGPLSDSSPATG